jgi:serine/threonine protein kinase
MDYLESNKIIHRDIKPGNILLKRVIIEKDNKEIESWIPKITDFGMARKFRHVQSKTQTAGIGTEIYNAPELWRLKYGQVSNYPVLSY